ncbi:sigma-70 family RNA polymerase sigma factor [bacterium BFN5]|nr:sigma-70 family RNA polymerase sigma factor [bacterium BFN5]QJW47353.1 sigma-70 family RNA polymerase sigma factor [bacterium BFN5]
MEFNQLVMLAQTGNDEAFEQVCQQYAGLVKRQAYQAHLRPIQEEALAEGWLALSQAVVSYNPALGVQFAGYAESKVKFALWNLFKRERRRWQHEMPLQAGGDDNVSILDLMPDNVDIASQVENNMLANQVLALLTKLPQRQQQAVLMTVVQGKRLSEAAFDLQLSSQAVYNLRQRGLARLKQLWNGMYESERG